MPDGVDLCELVSWMDRGGIGFGEIIDVCHLAGGTQNILLQFSRGGATYVLRRPPLVPRTNSNEAMRREARVLQALANSTVPHPRLIASCPDENVLGAAFYLMAPVDGYNPNTGLAPLHAGDSKIRHRIGLSMIDAIAALGAVD
jgi:aminoglycoside phosphotransferase (APT) family kinase protein